MSNPNNKQLLAYMKDVFSDEEVKMFSFSYFPDVMDHYGANMSEIDKLIILISFCQRHKQMEALLEALKTERPDSHEELLALLTVPETNSSPETAVETVETEETEPLPAQEAQFNEETFFDELTELEFIHIPAGEFIYGEGAKATKINLPEFWISKTPVTNAVYQYFIDENPEHRVPKTLLGGSHNWDSNERTYPEWRADHPVTLVSQDDALAFCQWADLSLPTEMQWEKAARGTDGRIFPWGNDVPTRELCNFGRNESDTTHVGRYSPQGDSPYGCIDMSGNVCEWCVGETPFLRNGGYDSSERDLRTSYSTTSFAGERYDTIGFRVVMNSSPWD